MSDTERHQAAAQALAECIAKNVSAHAVAQLAMEAGITPPEVIQLYQEPSDE